MSTTFEEPTLETCLDSIVDLHTRRSDDRVTLTIRDNDEPALHLDVDGRYLSDWDFIDAIAQMMENVLCHHRRRPRR
jgi:hypothetical protein